MLQSFPADKLRPITVLSTWWRLWGATRLHSTEIQSWIQQWWPHTSGGGRRGAEIFDILVEVDQFVDEGKYIIALDFSLAFDHLHPNIALHAFQSVGLPPSICQMLQNVWCNQKRVLLYARQACDEVQPVGTSIPQGDGWSMLAISLVLKYAAKAVQQQVPSIQQRLYVDDRTLAATDLQDALMAKELWRQWSAHLGLVENQAKAVHFHKSSRGRSAFITEGIPVQQVTDHPKILGVEFQGNRRRATSTAEHDRIESVVKCLHRARWLPVSWEKLKVFLATGPLAKATWGWFARLPPKRSLVAFRLLFKLHSKNFQVPVCPCGMFFEGITCICSVEFCYII